MDNSFCIKLNMSNDIIIENLPGLSFFNNDIRFAVCSLDQKQDILLDFAKYLLKLLKKLYKRKIRKNIRNYKISSYYNKLVNFLTKLGFIKDDFNTLLDDIYKDLCVYRYSTNICIGVNPNHKFKRSKYKTIFIVKCLEFGNQHIPPRLLVKPLIDYIYNNIEEYWSDYLSEEYETIKLKYIIPSQRKLKSIGKSIRKVNKTSVMQDLVDKHTIVGVKT